MSTAAAIQNDAPNYTAIKTKQQAAWGSGDYARIGVTLQITGEQLCEAMDLRAGSTVLDVAAGNGNATLAAARRFCFVTSTDYVDSLLEQSARRAEAEGAQIDYRNADAEALPFADASFDNVVSTFGVMFTPNQATAAAELSRVVKTGGKIGLVNWTPAGFIGQLFKIIGSYIAPPPGVSPPSAWGTEAFLQQHFADAASISTISRNFMFRYRSPEHWLDLFSTYYGPLLKAFEALDAEKGAALRSDITRLMSELNQADDGTLVLPSEYLETVITR